MVFSSPEFLFVFMPAFFSLYYATPGAWKNFTIFAASLVFYALAGGYVTIVLLASIAANHWIARAMVRRRAGGGAWLALGIVCNLAPLFYYKYSGFAVQTWDDAARLAGAAWRLDVPHVLLPAGISFYTFHGVSYLVDIRTRKVAPAPSLIDFGMYMVNFPQLIAGPIVRYVEIAGAVRGRRVGVDDVWDGLVRFVLGLGKKLVLADSMGSVADRIFALPGDQLTTSLAWLGAVTYTLQIFFDFSGYSDMAIGMGRMMGFVFPENFDQPYRAASITEFWRRWHMTLSRWFRDYVYIPLGGNRAGAVRTLGNLFAVFVLCGLWHGAAYTFVIWGMYHGALLVIERVLLRRFGLAPSGIAGQALTLLLVMVGWVFFRSPTLSQALHHLAVMAHLHPDPASMFDVRFYLTNDRLGFLGIAILVALLPERLRLRLPRWNILLRSGQIVFVLALLVYASALVAANGFNPFIYFRF